MKIVKIDLSCGAGGRSAEKELTSGSVALGSDSFISHSSNAADVIRSQPQNEKIK